MFVKLYILSLGVLGVICVLLTAGPAGIFAGLLALPAVPAYVWLNQRGRLDALEEENQILEKQARNLEKRLRILEQEKENDQ